MLREVSVPFQGCFCFSRHTGKLAFLVSCPFLSMIYKNVLLPLSGSSASAWCHSCMVLCLPGAVPVWCHACLVLCWVLGIVFLGAPGL